ncbi:protein ALP1-like [Acyrthosiphon pisum]|uniref:DDE Tnp4 domain-containing protein n=1 Tax=Acyrthosiphon pisum TaxID=7029 RepID=A0A8R2NTA0_ACYPI|nr:protein ALP1-like [Acyrthosiphon pisum]
MRQGLDTEIKVVFVHTHRVYNAEAYSYLRVSEEVRENFITYFNGGMTPAAAKTYHEVQLTSSIDDADNMECIQQLANAQINPTDRQIYQLYETWRYLATGDSHHTIGFSFRVGRTTVSSIVKEVCVELWNVLQPLYLATPTEEVWKNSEIGFRELWNFPNCIGSIDGKHVRIKCPPKTGSSFFCYKNFCSIVLLGIVDPNYKFLIVDIGSYGRHSDSSIFENSSFYREFIQGKTILPPKPLPGTTTPVPHVFVGDEGFKLETFLMRPFPRAVVAQNEAKKVFNKRLSRARRVVENAFGILAQKWRVFFRPIELEVDTAEHVVKAACCLHNYLRSTSTIENEP